MTLRHDKVCLRVFDFEHVQSRTRFVLELLAMLDTNLKVDLQCKYALNELRRLLFDSLIATSTISAFRI